MGSAFLCAALGIVPTVRHADYLGVLAGGAARGQSRDLPRRQRREQGRRLAARAPRAVRERRRTDAQDSGGGSRHDPPEPRPPAFALRANAILAAPRLRATRPEPDPTAGGQIVQPAGRRDMARDRTRRGWRHPVRPRRPRLRLPRTRLLQPVRNRQRALPFGLPSSATFLFHDGPLSVWADMPRRAGSILWAETVCAAPRSSGDPSFPRTDPPGGG
jgi:hypothetical protein